jgi:hypothetical protein
MEFVEIPIGEGSALVVEVEDTEAVVAAGRAHDLAARGIQTFQAAMGGIREAASTAVEEMTQLARPPEEVTLQFSVQLAAEAGVVVARTAATANMNISLTWNLGRRDD